MRQKREVSRRLLAALAAVVVLGGLVAVPQGAMASLIGDTITITSTANFPLDTWTDDVVVGDGAELVGGDTSEHSNTFQGQTFAALFPGDFYDIGASTITIHYEALGSAGFLYPFNSTFSDLDWLPIAGTLDDVTVAASSGFGGVSITNITTSGFLFAGVADLETGAEITLNLITTHAVPVVPEPATLPLFAVGLIGLMYCLRRRRKVWTGVGFHAA